MKSQSLHNGMIVFWHDPEAFDNPDNDASCYDILCDVDYTEQTGTLGSGIEVFLHECRPLTSDELRCYIESVDCQIYPDVIVQQNKFDHFYGRQNT